METYRKQLLEVNFHSQTLTHYTIERKEDVELLIMKICKAKGARPVKRSEIKFALDSTEAKLRYEFNSVSRTEFFKQLNFHNKRKLVF